MNCWREGDIETAKKELKELREDTQKDIERSKGGRACHRSPTIIAHNKKIERF